jgi:alpha-beta hydrolase superfamily lysophospholipase
MIGRRELLIVPMDRQADSGQVYSGVARMAGVLWCTRALANPGRRADTVVLVVHPSSNFLGHYALEAWAAQGVDAVAMTTRYIGNDSVLLLENCVLDVASVVRHLRAEGYERIVLVGNSGGGGLVALYQEQATAPRITSAPGGAGPDLTEMDIPAVDALVMLMAHPGRANLMVEFLDPAVLSESNPFERDPDLDLFHPDRELPLAAEWLKRYRMAQFRRNERITDLVIGQLDQERARTGRADSDLPLLVHATCADPRAVDLTIDPSDRKPGTLWGDAADANYKPTTLGHHSSLQSWLSQWSMRTSNGNGPECLKSVDVPVHVIYGTADQACFPAHAQELFDAVRHDRKRLTAVRGGRHYLDGQPEQTAQMADALVSWVRGLA